MTVMLRLRLLGLTNLRLDLVLTAMLLLVLLASRFAALPATIWDQDEAYMAAAVVAFDPTALHPHPPWFPLWLVLGKAVHTLGAEPDRALQLVSLAFSWWIVFPLTALWSHLVPRRQAVLATLLFLALPGPWLFAGRAFTGTAATALLASALALWIRRSPSRLALAAGSFAAGCALLIRPQFAVALAITLPLMWRRTAVERLRWLLLPLGAMLIAGGVGLVATSGGAAELLESLVTHAGYHLGGLSGADRSLAASGLARALGHPVAAVGWVFLSVLGTVVLLRQSSSRSASTVLLAALLPLAASIWFLADPGHARYAVPLLALSSGLVIAALAWVSRHSPHLAVTAAVLASVLSIFPELPGYRSEAAPTLEALNTGATIADREGGAVCVDHRLVAFVDLETATQRLASPVLFDHVVALNGAVALPDACAAAVLAAGHPALGILEGPRRSFSCTGSWMRRLTRSDFCTVTVIARSQRLDAGGPAEEAEIVSESDPVDVAIIKDVRLR